MLMLPPLFPGVGVMGKASSGSGAEPPPTLTLPCCPRLDLGPSLAAAFGLCSSLGRDCELVPAPEDRDGGACEADLAEEAPLLALAALPSASPTAAAAEAASPGTSPFRWLAPPPAPLTEPPLTAARGDLGRPLGELRLSAAWAACCPPVRADAGAATADVEAVVEAEAPPTLVLPVLRPVWGGSGAVLPALSAEKAATRRMARRALVTSVRARSTSPFSGRRPPALSITCRTCANCDEHCCASRQASIICCSSCLTCVLNKNASPWCLLSAVCLSTNSCLSLSISSSGLKLSCLAGSEAPGSSAQASIRGGCGTCAT